MKKILLLSIIFITKLNVNAQTTFQKAYGGLAMDEAKSVRQTTDGGYILGGRSGSNSSPDKSENNLGFGYDYWVVKLNAGGIMQWENTIGGS